MSDGPGRATARAGCVPQMRHGARAGIVSAPAMRTEWTCPMHPEIVRDAPGSCPICGMALEPPDVVVDEDRIRSSSPCRGGSGPAPR